MNRGTRFYRGARALARWGVDALCDVVVEGEEHVPSAGPCILAPNHQSALDPLLVQGNCPRAVDTMTKSTQFSSPVFRWLLTRGGAFPACRYRVDPQSVRVLLRKLDEGRAVCVYPEGERTWNGAVGRFRTGTLRVLLRVGVPVVPVGIDGMYDVWPRWAARPRAGLTVHLRFGEPLHFDQYFDRQEREAALPMVERRLRRALLRLSGEERRRAGETVLTAPDSGRRSRDDLG